MKSKKLGYIGYRMAMYSSDFRKRKYKVTRKFRLGQKV